MKSKEELNALKEEVKALNAKLSALTEEELAQVTGGVESRDVPEQPAIVLRLKSTALSSKERSRPADNQSIISKKHR